MSCWKHAVLHVKTGGGKTYTMDGDRSASDSLANSAGVIPRTVELIFQEAHGVFLYRGRWRKLPSLGLKRFGIE